METLKNGLGIGTPGEAPPEETDPRPPYALPTDRLGASRRELWDLRAANRAALRKASEVVAQAKSKLEKHEAEVARLAPIEAQTRAPLEAHRAQVQRVRAELDRLGAMEEPTPQSMAEEEAAKRKIPKLEAREAELLAEHTTARDSAAGARKEVDASLRSITVAELHLESIQLGADVSESILTFRIRALEHAERATAGRADTQALRHLSKGGDENQLNFVRLHRHYAQGLE